MKQNKKIALPLVLILTLLASGLVYYFYFADRAGIEQKLRGKEPFGVRLALIDDTGNDSLELISQLIVFPGQRQVLFLFMNSSAHFVDEEKTISQLSPSAADRFHLFSNLKNRYHITLTRTNAARLVDLVEGISYFLDNPLFLKDSLYQYPEGVQKFSGEQLLEYALADELIPSRPTLQQKEPFYFTISRQFRKESTLLNALWQQSEMASQLRSESLEQLAYSLLKTNLQPTEIKSLFSYIENANSYETIEAPLTLTYNKNNQRNPTGLAINVANTRQRYEEYEQKLKAGRTLLENFAMEILNGTERGGLARRLKQIIDDQTFLILGVSNYPHKPRASTIIVEHSGNSLSATLLSRKTGIKRDRVFFLRRSGQIDITFVIGTDFNFKNINLN